jgi:hypothetical protein
MNTASRQSRETARRDAQRGLSDVERMGVSHEEFRSTRRRGDGDRVGRRRDVGQTDRGGTLAGAPIGMAMKAAGTLAATVQVWLDSVAVVAAGA